MQTTVLVATGLEKRGKSVSLSTVNNQAEKKVQATIGKVAQEDSCSIVQYNTGKVTYLPHAGYK